MAIHRLYLDDPLPDGPPEAGWVLAVSGEEARHAIRVKRVEVGDGVELLDGLGRVASGVVAGTEKQRGEWVLRVAVRGVERVERVRPRVEVVSAAPKGARLGEMIDQLSQVGAASWSPLESARTVVEPGAGKLERLERVAAEAAKQCGRAWRLEIGAARRFEEVIAEGVVVADASGERYRESGAEVVRVVIGPEGGWTEEELDAARRMGCRVVGFGPHTMRIETAAAVGVGVVMEAEGRVPGA